MKEITLPAAAKYTSPNPVTIVCSKKDDGSTNLATVSWWTYLSYNPCMIAYAMAKTSFSGEMVRKNGEVVLTIPSEKLADLALKCGSCTGRNTNKAEKFSAELIALPNCDIKIPGGSCLTIVCSLKEFTEVGDHYLYICNVKQVYADDGEKPVFAWNGYSQIRPIG